jgi:hypothetical protein
METPVRGNGRALVALTSFLRETYKLQEEGDAWTYEKHSGHLRARPNQALVFLAPDHKSGDGVALNLPLPPSFFVVTRYYTWTG